MANPSEPRSGDQRSSGPAATAGGVVVVGSLNEDLRLPTPAVPRAGETVLGGPHSWGIGGKGNNQAVAAARFDAAVTMLGRVGNDAGGRRIRQVLDGEGVDTQHLLDGEQPTGLALIILEPSGENRIIVSPGANGELVPAQLEQASSVLADAAVVLAQLEIDPEMVLAAFRATTGTTVLNAAPARQVSAELLAATSVLVVNEGELAALAGRPDASAVADVDAVVAAAAGVSGPDHIVVTRGAAGAVVIDRTESHRTRPDQLDPDQPDPDQPDPDQPGVGRPDPERTDVRPLVIPAPAVTVVDTTGAGDCFCGVLAAALSAGAGMADAAGLAVRAASIAATRSGAAEAMPYRREVPASSAG
ncbi:ribokinase [Nakamurella aerolata]|uniref:Ribokinase n=1 Tax=Nakamurella aerolata TaxID=1656892 RepID=A0A849AAV4_9ACTN|nr:ribokinase [Nakamurella aerolata]NNG37077.1 ribokinase [Nakamurella aerolata]